MKEFILAALPWVAIGITMALLAVTDNSKKNDSSEDNYLPYGMSLGMCFGVALGSAFTAVLDTNALTYGLCFGILGGTLVAMLLKKSKRR